MLENNKHNSRPYFSICIPQHNRTDFLIKALSSFVDQTFTDFEVCIYDDNSDDKGEDKIVKFLKNSGLNYSYFKSDTNGRYDISLRGSINLSGGKYVLLMGNDDGLIDCNTLELIHGHLEAHENISVVITNYVELTSGKKVKRVLETKEYGSGPKVASSIFRNYAFVSGILFDGDKSRGLSTDKVDGSEMYQMYLATSIVSNGGRVLGIKDICIEKDLQIKGQEVDGYQYVKKVDVCSVKARILPMARIFEVIMAGLEGSHYDREKEKNLFIVAKQLYKYTYPYWIIEYRRVQSWCYSFGVYRAVNPLVICSNTYNLSFYSKVKLTALYITMGVIGFIIPISIFDKIRPTLFKFAKKQ